MEPAGAPACWGKQFDADDDECANGCNYNTSCRPATINNASNVSVRRTGPMFPQPPQPPSQFQLPVIQQQQYIAPRFGSPIQAQQPSSFPRPPAPTMFAQNQQQVPVAAQPHAPPGWNSPIAYLPRPNPANPTWWQYQNETTRSRLGKNIVLSALQAIFAELLRFFANWTWPALG